MRANDSQSHSDLDAFLRRLPAPTNASPELVSALRERVLNEYDLALAASRTTTRWQQVITVGMTLLTRPRVRWAAVAAVVAIVIAGTWTFRPRASLAFADLIAPVVDAKSGRFKVSITNDVQPQAGKPKPVTAKGFFLAPQHFRQEILAADGSSLVTFSDFERGRMVSLFPAKKEAMVFEIKGLAEKDNKLRQSDVFGTLRAALAAYRRDQAGQLVELGEQEIDGRRAVGFRLSTSGMVQTLWGDPQTERLIRVDSAYFGPPKTEVVMSDFEFDVPLEGALFALEPPEGYKSTTIPINAAKPTEQDFIESLRRLRGALDGGFPSSLDTPGITLATVKLMKGKDTREMMTLGAKWPAG